MIPKMIAHTQGFLSEALSKFEPEDWGSCLELPDILGTLVKALLGMGRDEGIGYCGCVGSVRFSAVWANLG